jgi:4-oxalocrotonate tautomerase family enzyme
MPCALHILHTARSEATKAVSFLKSITLIKPEGGKQNMPHISIKGPEIPLDVKRRLAEEVTKVASEVYGIPKEKFMIHIMEFSKENIATAGSLLVDK